MTPKIAIVWRGDFGTRRTATPQNNRYYRVFEELAVIGIQAEPAVYDETFAEEVRDQLLAVDGVLLWVNPLDAGNTRAALDPLLRDVATRGPWVSAHPDVILKMGVKEVLYPTKSLGWGTDTQVYLSPGIAAGQGFDSSGRSIDEAELSKNCLGDGLIAEEIMLYGNLSEKRCVKARCGCGVCC